MRNKYPEAYKYIKSKPDIQGFNKDCRYLSGMFIWHLTPQGHDYWSKINDEINRRLE